MAVVLSEYLKGRDNNFNLIRFIGAVTVIFTHSYALTGKTAQEPVFALTGFLTGEISLDIFIITSGFLVTSSLYARKDLVMFAWARMLRIYPALIAAMIFCAIPLGLLFTNLPARGYLSDWSVYHFILNNGTLITGPLQYFLPGGVFADAPFLSVVNGSIWTLLWELRLYAFLMVLALIAWRTNWMDSKRLETYLVALGVILTVIHIANRIHPFYQGGGTTSTIRFGSLFFIGASFYVLRNRIIISHRTFFAVMAVLVLFAGRTTLYFVLMKLLLCYVVFYLAYVPAGWIRMYNKLGDYSYGTYLYAFPVQQALAVKFPGIGIAPMFFASLAITLVLAILSWHLLEKQMLKKKEGHVHLRNVLSRLRLVASPE